MGGVGQSVMSIESEVCQTQFLHQNDSDMCDAPVIRSVSTDNDICDYHPHHHFYT